MPRHGRKRQIWVILLHSFTLDEFYRLKDAGAKITRLTLCDVARHGINQDSFSYGDPYIDPVSEQPVPEMIDFKFTERFCERFGIVIRSQTGNKLRSAAYTEYSERCTTYPLGTLSREFGEGTLNENNIENLDETHLLYDSDSHKMVAMRGESIIDYHDVVSGSIGMT